MFDETQPVSLILIAITGVVVSGAIGLLARSRIRTAFIVIWSLAPTLFITFVGLSFAWNFGLFAPGTLTPFPAIFILLVQPPWLLLTLLPFNLVRRYREIQRWEA